nr:putative reverse transcriptase domain-containing protein [Tanacetum cinerariifolium]
MENVPPPNNNPNALEEEPIMDQAPAALVRFAPQWIGEQIPDNNNGWLEEDPKEEAEEEEENDAMVNNEEDDAEIADADDVPIPPVIQFDGIEAAIRDERERVKREATRAGGPAGGPVTAPMARECSFASFMKCSPTQFHGTEGAVGQVCWFEKMDNTFEISEFAEGREVKFATSTLHGRALTWWNSQVATLGREVANGRPWSEVKQMMTDEFCPTEEVQRLEDELRHLKLRDMNIAAYTERFNEFALLCPDVVPNEKKKAELYIKGLPEIIKAKNERIAEGLKRKWENNNQGNNNHNRDRRSTLSPIKSLEWCSLDARIIAVIVGEFNQRQSPSDIAKPASQYYLSFSSARSGMEEEEAFQTLKQKLCSAPILALPEGTENFIVYCNASLKGCGAVLMQREKKELNMRQRLWIELLSDYQCEIHYHPGKGNVVADALSRKDREPLRVRSLVMTDFQVVGVKRMAFSVQLLPWRMSDIY